jgi:hypothetical protein
MASDSFSRFAGNSIGPVRRMLTRLVPSVRALQEENVQLRAAHDGLRAAHDGLLRQYADTQGAHAAQEAAMAHRLDQQYVRHRPEACDDGEHGFCLPPPIPDDTALAERIRAAYRATCQTPLGAVDSFWLTEFAQAKHAEHEILMSGTADEAARMLRNPRDSMLLHGFDQLNAQDVRLGAAGSPFYQPHVIYDALLRLAEAIGLERLHWPEASVAQHPPVPEVEALLSRLDGALGFRVDFPNPFPGEEGLVTTRGVASNRAIQALYQAWRVAALVGAPATASVCEIGPGLGRTAYYARRLGVGRYALVDIPLSAAAQAYFLGRTLGADSLRLFGEPADAPITLATPNDFLYGASRYDLILNADSLTEMSPATAADYWAKIKDSTPVFLSINHEFNPLRFRDLYGAETPTHRVDRTPYWLRRGYVEELVRFP